MSAFHLTVATSNTSLRRTGRRDLREAKASLLFFCLAGALPGRLGTKQHSPTGDREPGQPSDSAAPPGGRSQLQDLEPRAAGALREIARACPTVPGYRCGCWPGRAPPRTAVVPVPEPDPALWAELPSWARNPCTLGTPPLNGALIPRNHARAHQ